MDKTIIAVLDALTCGRVDYVCQDGAATAAELPGGRGSSMYPPHAHTFTFEMIYKVEGAVQVLIGDSWRELPEGRLWVLMPGTLHTERCACTTEPYRMLWSTLLPGSFSFHHTCYEPGRGYRVEKSGMSISKTGYAAAAALAAAELLEKQSLWARAKFQAAVMQGLCHIHDNRHKYNEAAQNDNRHMLTEVKDYIDNFYWHKDLCLSRIADLVRYSHSHLNLVFRKEFGVPIHQYIISRRLQAAEKMLGGRQLNIGEIAAAVGIQDQLYFSRLFRKHFGRSPKEYAAVKLKQD